MNQLGRRTARIACCFAITTLAGVVGALPGCTIPLDPPDRAGSAEGNHSGKNFRDPVMLAEVRERAVSVVEAGVRSANAEVRANSIEAASKLPARMENLVALGLTDSNEAVRTVAAMSVGRSKLDRLCPAAGALQNDPSPFVRAAAIFALAKNGREVDQSPLAVMLASDPSSRVRSHVAFVLGELGNASAAPMVRQASRLTPGRGANAGQVEIQLMQLQFAEAMVKLTGDEVSLETLRAALYPSRPEELESTALAVQILGQVRDRKSVDNLIYLASYRDQSGNLLPAEVRLSVAGALARMGMPQGAFVADEYWTSEIPAVRAQCAFVYGVTGGGAAGGPQNMERLDTLLGDPDERVRVAAAAGVLTQNQAQN